MTYHKQSEADTVATMLKNSRSFSSTVKIYSKGKEVTIVKIITIHTSLTKLIGCIRVQQPVTVTFSSIFSVKKNFPKGKYSIQ